MKSTSLPFLQSFQFACALHLISLFFLLYFTHTETPKPLLSKAVKMRTFVLVEPTVSVKPTVVKTVPTSTGTPSVAPKVSTEKVKVKTSPKATQTPVPTKKTVKKVKKQTPIKKTPSPQVSHKNQQNLDRIKKAQARLNRLSSRKKAITPSSLHSLPSAIEISHNASSDTASIEKSLEEKYQLQLTQYLKVFLKLPEYGDVQIDLVLKRNGQVQSLLIQSTESQRNAQYLKQSLPPITFPEFGKAFLGKTLHRFTLVVSNE